MKKITQKQKERSDKIATLNSRAVKRDVLCPSRSKTIAKIDKQKKHKITAPSNFSLKQNTNLVLEFFNKLDRAVDKKHFVCLDLSNITSLTVDTLIYFIACLKRYDYNDKDYRIQTKNPRDKELKQMMIKSGLLEFSKEKKFIKDEDVIQIHYGDKDNRELIKKICHFISDKFDIESRIYTKNIYRILSELMYNTIEHAYISDSNADLKNWYIYCSFDTNIIKIVFMDTGRSIPKTINKRLVEKLHLTGITASDLLVSALKGEHRTRTKKRYRGLGLQALLQLENTELIQDLSILSHKGRYGNIYLKNHKHLEIKGTIINFNIEKKGLINGTKILYNR